uniref:Elongation of very long chain fatty acids protein n=1 Tax=Tetranychus urticae TaxID=32264 RepID=T1KD01_TETUR
MLTKSNSSELWDSSSWIAWHSSNWLSVLPFIPLYLLSLKIGVKFMTKRPAFQLDSVLAYYNAFLALFSLIGAWITGAEMINVLISKGYHDSVCHNSYVLDERVQFWNWLWTWSKLLEFCDTMFIILRKRPLTFLHVYHHSLTAFCAFYFWHTGLPMNRWTITMNFIVHSLMYTYFSVHAMGYSIPQYIPIMVTTLQISQMVAGCGACSYALYSKVFNHSCKLYHGQHIAICQLTYISYAILFAKIFHSKYLVKRKSRVKIQ